MCNNNKKCACNCKKETKLLGEAIDLNINPNRQREAVKYAKNAHDSLMSIYSLSQKSDVTNKIFLDILDKSFQSVNTLLSILVMQEEKKGNKIKNNINK